MSVRVLYLTCNPYLESTTRALSYWVAHADPEVMVRAVVPKKSELAAHMHACSVPMKGSALPWLNKTRPWTHLSEVFAVGKWAKQIGVDVIHCNEHNVYPFAASLRRALRKPVICHVRYQVSPGFASWMFRGRRAPDRLIWTSDQQKVDSMANWSEDVIWPESRTIPPGVDAERFAKADGAAFREKWNIPADAFFVVTASPLRPRKRVHEFLTSVGRLSQKNSKIWGMVAGREIAGDESYAKQIRTQCDQLNSNGRIRWIGHLDEVEHLYAAADLIVSTSEYETFGNSVVEGMAAGKPVVSYAAGSIPEVMADTGILVPLGDVDCLTREIEALTHQPDRCVEIGRIAQERAFGNYSPEASRVAFKTVYEELLPDGILNKRLNRGDS